MRIGFRSHFGSSHFGSSHFGSRTLGARVWLCSWLLFLAALCCWFPHGTRGSPRRGRRGWRGTILGAGLPGRAAGGLGSFRLLPTCESGRAGAFLRVRLGGPGPIAAAPAASFVLLLGVFLLALAEPQRRPSARRLLAGAPCPPSRRRVRPRGGRAVKTRQARAAARAEGGLLRAGPGNCIRTSRRARACCTPRPARSGLLRLPPPPPRRPRPGALVRPCPRSRLQTAPWRRLPLSPPRRPFAFCRPGRFRRSARPGQGSAVRQAGLPYRAGS